MPNLQNQSLAESGQIVTTGDTGVVTSTMIADGTIVNADVSTSAAIALSKLASGSSAQVILANATGVATYVTPSGDVSWDNTGNVQIVANTIVNADINSAAAIALTKLASGSSAQIVLANSTGVATYTAVSGDITITNAGVTALASNITISNNLTVTGNLTVNGTTTTVNTATLNIADNIITLNSYFITGTPTENAGIEVLRGGSSTTAIRWNETTDKWQFTNDGSTYNDLGSGGGATNSLTAPTSPTAGALWFKTDTAQTFVYYDSYWVEVGASGMAAMVSDTAPSSPIAGQIWFNSGNGGTYVYYSSAWTEIGAVPINALLNTIDAKGDLIAGTADNTVGRLGVGTNGFFLKANSSTATGLEWASIPTINALDDVGDVTITSASSGQVLQWNGSAWINATVSSDVMTDAKNAALIIMDIGS